MPYNQITMKTTLLDNPINPQVSSEATNASAKTKRSLLPIKLDFGVSSITSDRSTGSVNVKIGKVNETPNAIPSSAYFNLMLSKLESMAYRVDRIEERVGKINNKMDEFNEHVDKLGEKMTDMDDRIIQLQVDTKDLSDQIDRFLSKRKMPDSEVDDESDSEVDRSRKRPYKTQLKGVKLTCDHCHCTRIYDKSALTYNPVTFDSCFTCVDCDGINGIYDECIPYVWNC